MLVGALIGTVSINTAINDVNPVLYIAMGVLAIYDTFLYQLVTPTLIKTIRM